MGSDDLFEAVSHHMRIEIVRVLAEKPYASLILKEPSKLAVAVFWIFI